MASGHNACLKRLGNRLQIVFHALLTGHFHLLEDVVVATGDQNARLTDAEILNQLKVLLAGTDPGRDLGKFQSQLLTLLNSVPVLLTINKELGLANDAVGTAQLGHQLEEIHDLLDGIRLHRLLSVTEGGIGDPDILRHSDGHASVVEGNARNVGVRINVTVKIGLLNVLQGIFIGALLQQVCFIGNF